MCLEISEYFGADCLICSPQAGLENKNLLGDFYIQKKTILFKKGNLLLEYAFNIANIAENRHTPSENT